jgi:hypothetical protein
MRHRAEQLMLYLVIETFKEGKVREVYQRAHTAGRMLPPGLEYLDSWVTEDFTRCYQLMSCDDPRLLEQWQRRWDDIVEFQCIAVRSSADAAALILKQPN